ncbi:nucleotidyltransferase domain-containing protein [Terrisporobacter vanillatitrophus]|uniref:nucleotidyltransferase domain-containing protein n=1 Tax=Terrisporobacter vanillatitrophus TaxID=3058402 RepID=UPI003367FA58
MDLVQKQIIKYIKTTINGKKMNIDKKQEIDWQRIINLSREHKVEALVYSAIPSEIKNSIPEDLLNFWKKEVFISGVTQQQHIKEVEKILHNFNEENIEVLVLKGLVIRDLYPSPTIRTMSDADIVVKEEDLEKSIELILNRGYVEIEQSPSHFVYSKGGCLPIELHWNLADEHFFKQITKFEEDMWHNVEEVNIGSAVAKTMSLEDLAIFQCIHMAKHMVYRGFGIRHLIDFTLLVNKRGNEIKWIRFMDRCKKYGIYKFVLKVMLACNTLFEMPVPSDVEDVVKEDKSYLNQFIEDIFKSGVHGKQDFVSSVASEFAYTSDKKDGENTSSLKRYARFLFPRVENMSDIYNYAKNYKILTPIAWTHHLARGVFNKDYSMKDKIKFTTSTVGISQKRNDLINWLEL